MRPYHAHSLYRSETDDRRRALYNRALTDGMIEELEGVDKTSIAQWRWRRGLPANDSLTICFDYAGPSKKALREERIRLMHKGWTDGAIAFHQKRAHVTIWQFRKRHGLPRATGTLDDQPRIISYEAAFVDQHMPDDNWSNWLEEMGATVW